MRSGDKARFLSRHGVWCLFVVALALLASASAMASLTGAIFTTTRNGEVVDGNIYERAGDVYLSGGPQNENAQGLPSGVYYFQVTDPSGSALLSTDCAADRQLFVDEFGRVAGIAGTTGTHNIGHYNRRSGVLPVQLAPFAPTPNPGNEYKAWLVPVEAAIVGADCRQLMFSSSDSKTDNFKVRRDGPGPAPESIVGLKFYDANLNGVRDAGEPGITGWRIEKMPPDPADTTYTIINGTYGFIVEAGTYTITEVAPGGFFPSGQWRPTTPTSGIVVVRRDDVAGPVFGNVCLGAGGGHGKGYWHNQNGFETMNDGGSIEPELALLRSLNLRDENGNNLDPATFEELSLWLTKESNAVNMAEMLSAQLAAMVLNLEAGFVNPSALVYAAGTASANSVGFATISAIITEADAQLATDPLTLAGDPNRAIQTVLKNALDYANNNVSFLQPAPCAFATPY